MSGNESLREIELWLKASRAEADGRLPGFLGVPTPLMLQELEARPELRTVGMMQRLLEVVQDAHDRFPQRAYELTAVLVESVPRVVVPARYVTLLRRLEGLAWLERARALQGIRHSGAAREALAVARELFARDPGNAWHLAAADLVEAPILHDLGWRGEALRLVRSAARQFALHRQQERYAGARMVEVWMLWTAGDRDQAAAVLQELMETARLQGDSTLAARVAGKVALFELRHGSAEKASELFTAVLDVFDDAGLRPEAIRARWSLAEALADRGRLHEAISELYKVHGELLARGEVTDAALAAAAILELLPAAGREGEALRLADTLVFTFRDAGMPMNALEAFTYLRALASRGSLGDEDVTAVRRYFEDFRQFPNARFFRE
jgi:tetratricopeptide (TPR) repeat protein